MKTLQNIKDNYAKEQGYEDWEDLSEETNYADDYELHWTSVCLRAQKAALEKAAENAYIHYPVSNNFNSCVDETTITNEQNLIQ